MTPYRSGNTVIDLDNVFATKPIVNNRGTDPEYGVQVIATGGGKVELWSAEADRFMDRFNTFIDQGQYFFPVQVDEAA